MSVWDIAVLKILPSMCSVAQFCPTLSNPMDYSPPGSSLSMGFYWAKILKWVAVSSSKGSSRPRGGTRVSWVSWTGRQILHHCTTSLPSMVVLKEQTKKPGWGGLGRPGITAPISHISSWTLIKSLKYLFPLSIKWGGGEMRTGELWWVNEVTQRHTINYEELYGCKFFLL